MLDESALNCVVAHSAFVTNYTAKKDGAIQGAVYDGQGQKIVLSERRAGMDRYRNVDPQKLDLNRPGIKLEGRSIYLGNFMAHYGHFLLETLSTFWMLPLSAPADYYVFHPFIFGATVHPYAASFMRVFGIEPSKLVIVQEPMHLENVVVPERVNDGDISHRLMRPIYGRIRSELMSAAPAPERVYLSRTRGRLQTRRITNEVEVEDVFRRAGFEIVHPQELTLGDQMALYARAKVIAGCSGSQLHNAFFFSPGTKLIEIYDPRRPNRIGRAQMVCNSISDVNYRSIEFQPASAGAPGDIDPAFVRRELETILTRP